MKNVAEPFLMGEGFLGSYPNFQRRESDQLQLLSVLFDKWGGGFFFEFANHPPGPLATSWGEVVPEEKLEVAYASIENRARLMSNPKEQVPPGYFRYSEFANDLERCEKLVAEAIGLFPQINAWLREKELGLNISAYSPNE